MRGLQEAEVTVIDQERYTWRDYFRRRDAGAELGVDFNLRDIHTSAAHAMLRESPLGLPEQIGLTPAMQRLFRHSTHLRVSSVVEELPDHDLTDVHLRSGGKFKDAIILSARAHSLLSPSEFYQLRWLAENPYMRAPLAERMESAGRLGRVFDVEHKKSLPILNELVATIAQASGLPPGTALLLNLRLPVQEAASHLSDHLQAADFAAGWAAELLLSTDSDFGALATKVRWMTVNGIHWYAREP